MGANPEDNIKPVLLPIEKKGDRVLWCACGLSKNQPLCDGSHKGTPFRPVPYVAKTDGEEILFCTCKKTKTPPFCDGTHNNLDAGYATAGAEEIARTRGIPVTGRDAGAFGRAQLDGGCYVYTPNAGNTQDVYGWRINSVINQQTGAKELSQYILEPGPNAEPVNFSGSEAVLYIARGAGVISSGHEKKTVKQGCAITIKPGEYFLITPGDGDGVTIIATVCPSCASINTSSNSHAAPPIPLNERIRTVNESQREAMGDRFYEVLADHQTGAGQLTQFIGEIPKSRAAAHRHLYEEALYIICGEGYMWTDTARAIVKPGDIIYLPRKQNHSLECTSAEGMKLAGAFYPAGSPAINY